MKRDLDRTSKVGTGPRRDPDEPNTARVHDRSSTPTASKRMVMTTDGSEADTTAAAEQGEPTGRPLPRSGTKL